jgi:ABC-2 type transport system ATP-binding protein
MSVTATPSATPRLVEAEGLGRRFGRQLALSGITFHVGRGEIFGVLGPDGAGKTTLLQMLAAILDPTQGRCRVLGYDTVRRASEINARVGYLSQGFTLYGRLTVAENLEFAARIRGIDGPVLAERRPRLLAMAGLAAFLDRPEQDLSGGMRKKLALCATLIHEPPLLLLDELSLGVDPASRRELWRMLDEFRRRGAIMVVTTSYMDEADQCDRVLFLDRGRIAAIGTPDELRARCAGLVHELRTASPGAAQAALALRPEVIGAQWRPGRVRFQLAPGQAVPAELAATLAPFGLPEEVQPAFEDIFAILAYREGCSALPPAAPAPAPKLRRPVAAGPAVEAGDLTRRFGGFTAVDRVSFAIAPGEIFGFLGPNGAGKTTVIRMLCDLLPPPSGRARVADVELGADPGTLRQRIGYMSQRFSLYPDLSVGENLAFFASAYGLAGARAQAAIRWAVSMTVLAGLEGITVANLSGAIRQRLALACSILHQPPVLFLDEPTSGVDPLSRFRLAAGQRPRRGRNGGAGDHALPRGSRLLPSSRPDGRRTADRAWRHRRLARRVGG